MSVIEFKNVAKSYGNGDRVIKDFSLEVEEGELIVFLGPSGCGKTTLLKMVNKMIPFNDGDIRVMDTLLKDWNTIELRRKIGYVIQQIGLLPHLTIRKNISFVQDISKEATKEEKNKKAEELIDLVGLEQDLLTRYPREVSGGQKQRIGVARALATDPDIILMDEPFGAVDEIARTALQDELIEIHRKLKKTILFVTHDIQEAFKLGTRIVLINDGRIVQCGTKEDLVFRPASDYVKEFFGTKGFQATLDSEKIGEFYERVLSNEITLEEFYERIEKPSTNQDI
ncbi:MAG: ATP-binding cassette domain-containing protein [Bacillota bacterium]